MKNGAATNNSDLQLVSSISPAAALELHNAQVPVVDLIDSPVKERVVAPTVKSEPRSNVQAAVIQSRVGALTEEQRERIEKQKQEALRRRQTRQQQSGYERCVTPARSAAVGRAFESSATVTKLPKMAASEDPQMNAQQQHVVEMVKRKKNVYFTGAAGTGKSFTTAQLIAYLKSVYRAKFSRRVAIVAPTGIAAAHINGVTINSASGAGVPLLVKDFGKMHAKTFALYNSESEKTEDKRVWAELQHLLLDEVSMLSGEYLDRLEEQVREVKWYYGTAPNGKQYRQIYSSCSCQEHKPTSCTDRRCCHQTHKDGKPVYCHRKQMPFMGGIQLVVCGDVFQLPPIAMLFDPAQYQLFVPDSLPEVSAEPTLHS